MNVKRISGILIIAGGLIDLAVGMIHFLWPFSYLRLPAFQEIDNSIRDLLLLMSLAVGLCLTVFSFLSFYFSSQIKVEIKGAWIFSMVQSIVWIFRLIFEILLPVRVSLYFINNPSNFLIGGISIIIVIYLFPVILLWKPVMNKDASINVHV